MGKLTRYDGNFVDCKSKIESVNQRIATAREGMLDRIKQGPNSHYSEKGCWHPEGTARIDRINYWCLVKYAPTIHYSQETLEANMAGKYLALTSDIKLRKKPASYIIKQIAEIDAKKPVEQRRVLIPENQSSCYPIQIDDFGNQEVPVFLARKPKLAQEYGNFLKNYCGITSVNIYQLSGNEDIASGFWLCRLEHGDNSNFCGDDRFSNDGSSLFGVAKREALSQRRSSTLSTQKNLRCKESDLKILQGVSDGKIPNKSLEKIIKRFL